MKNSCKIKTIKYILGLLIFVGVLFANIPIASADLAENLVDLTNSARQENGRGILTVNSALTAAATAKANDLISKDYFAHNSPDGKTPWDFITGAGYNYTYAGENLAIGYADASELFTAWMNSATHRENILNPNFREIGLAVVSGDYQGQETIVAVSVFGASASPTATSLPQLAAETSNNSSPSFSFVTEKTEFTPQSVYAGEEVTFKVTITGEVKTLEAQVFDKKYNLLESGSVTGSDEKTYTLKQKIENEGFSAVKIVGLTQNGQPETLNLGNLESKKTVLANKEASVNEKQGYNWFIYLAIFVGSAVVTSGYIVLKRRSTPKFVSF